LNWIFAIVAASCLLVPAVGHSQPAKSVTYKILGISVDGIDPKSGTDPGTVINNSGLKIGEEITVPGDQTRAAINRLWALHVFSDVQLLIDHKVEDGVYLLIRVTEYPRLDRVEVIGCDDVSKDDVMKKITIVSGQVLTPDFIQAAVENIKSLYADEGHLLAKITTEMKQEDTAKTKKVRLLVRIVEGPKVQIDRIYFSGNIAFEAGDLRGAFDDTKEKTWWQFWSHPRFDKVKFESDKRKLIKFYRNHGYLDAEVVSDSTWYGADKVSINVLVNVHEGPQYYIRSVTWDGATVYKPEELARVLQFKSGDVYCEDDFDNNLHGGGQDQPDVSSLYYDTGYLMFNLEPEIKRTGSDSLDIIIHMYERNKFLVGDVDITGNTKTQDQVIRRELFTRPGDFFNRSAILRSMRQLSQLNYFDPEKLKPDPKPRDDNKTVDVTYEVQEKSSDNVNASVGYSQAYGFTGALGFSINNFDITHPLEGGAGQILDFQWQFGEGQRFRTFTLGFTEPWLYGTPTTLGVSLFDTRQDYIYDIEQWGASVRVGRSHIKFLDDLMRVDYTFNAQRNNVIDNGGLAYYRDGLTTQFSVTQMISRNSTDSPIFPTQGSNISLSTEVSGGPILPGNVDYHKWLFNMDWYTSLFGSSRVVLFESSSFGYMDPFSNDSLVPPIDYFYMGGTGLGYINTIPLRGYDDRSVGPRDAAGNQLPARVMTKHTVELRVAVTLSPIPIYVLTFGEGGNLYTDFGSANFVQLDRSLGVGARLMINPIGMVGFDYAYGLDPMWPNLNAPSGWHFHFQFGKGF
jgi:outer membrane protein insertion porin family